MKDNRISRQVVFTAAMARAIVAVTDIPLRPGVTEAGLADALNAMAGKHNTWAVLEGSQTHTQRASLDAIGKDADRLARKLAAFAQGQADGGFGAISDKAERWAQKHGHPPVGPDAVRAAIESPRRLAHWLNEAAAGTGDADAVAFKDFSGPTARQWLQATALPSIYTAFFGRKFTIAKVAPEGESPGGPSVRFAIAALDHMGIKATPYSIDMQWRRANRAGRRVRSGKGDSS